MVTELIESAVSLSNQSSVFAPLPRDLEVVTRMRGNPEMRYFLWMKIFVNRD